MENKSRKEILKDLWAQFIPLSLSDVAMALGDPLHHWALSKTSNPRESLAAFGIGKSVAVFFESPIIMILHASNALGGNFTSRKKLKSFSFIFGLLLSCFLFISVTPTFFPLLKQIFDLSDDLAKMVKVVISFLVLWPLLISIRRFHQGLLIRYKFGKTIGRASLVRIFFVGSFLSIGVYFKWPGDVLAGIGLISGIIVETVLILSAFNLKKIEMAIELDSVERKNNLPKSFSSLFRYVLPLSISMVVVWGGRALLTALVARSIDVSMALAVWPVAWGIVVLVSNITRMVQQVVIGNLDQYAWKELIIFAWSVGVVLSIPLLFLVWSKTGQFILKLYLGDDFDFITSVQNILWPGLFFPLFTVFQNVYQGVLIRKGKTQAVNISSFVSVIVMLTSTFVMISELSWPGAYSAMLGMLLGLIVEFISLYSFSKK